MTDKMLLVIVFAVDSLIWLWIGYQLGIAGKEKVDWEDIIKRLEHNKQNAIEAAKPDNQPYFCGARAGLATAIDIIKGEIKC